MLASDLNNPQFVNPVNPDESLFVEFFWHQPEGPAKEANDPHVGLLPRVPYVRIVAPGMDKSVIETPVREDHKARWPQKWLAWQIREGLIVGANEDIPGWKLKEWGELNEGQLRELEFMRFSTVEQLAGASDSQVQRMGMGGLGLRQKAREALQAKQDEAVRQATAKQEAEIAELRARDAARDREMVEMRAQLAAMQKPETGQKRRGRPPKVRTEQPSG